MPKPEPYARSIDAPDLANTPSRLLESLERISGQLDHLIEWLAANSSTGDPSTPTTLGDLLSLLSSLSTVIQNNHTATLAEIGDVEAAVDIL